MKTAFVMLLVIGSLLVVGTDAVAEHCGDKSQPPVGVEFGCTWGDDTSTCFIWTAPNPTHAPCLV
jgi:hypothetical protein